MLSGASLIDGPLHIDGEDFQLTHLLASGKKGVVWKGVDRLGRVRAIKLATPVDYKDRPPLQEIALAAKLDVYECFARLERGARIPLPGLDGSPVVAALVSEWIDGPTLEHLLTQDPEEINPAFIRSYVSGVTDALMALDAEGLCHDDLNFGNVIAANPPPALARKNPDRTFKVIDLGSLKVAADHNTEKKGAVDDYRWTALHLTAMHNVCRRNEGLTLRDARFLDELTIIISRLLESDPVLRLRDPAMLAQQVESAWRRTQSGQARRVQHPFDYISAEQMADDAVLRNIFADSLPWLQDVNSTTPHVVTGPRGCGKSTMFRWLALRTHVELGHREPNRKEPQPEISGFYLPCAVELQNRVGWIRKDHLTDSMRAELIHYFTLLLMREVLRTLAAIDEYSAPEDPNGYAHLFDLNDSTSLQLFNYVCDAVLHDKPPLYSGVSRMRQLSTAVQAAVMASYRRIRDRNESPISNLLDESSLGDFTTYLVKLFPYFNDRHIVFLVDDFTVHRVPVDVQKVLNTIIWQRHPAHTFKLSGEKNGVVLDSDRGLTAEIARELKELDCGAMMLETSDAQLEAFAIELLDNRLAACEYTGRAMDLLGDSDLGLNLDGTRTSLAEALRSQALSKGAKNPVYFGIPTIAKLCSGDVAALLLVFERILRKGGVTPGTTSAVSRKTQQTAIRDVSRELVSQLRTYYPTGPRMHRFATEFGRYISHTLRTAPLQSTGPQTRRVPVESPRIEVDGQAAALETVEADEDLRELYDDLLRRAVLIDMDAGNARHGYDTSLRLHFRRVFLPMFNAPLGKNRPIAIKPDEFEYLLRSPKQGFELLSSKAGRKRSRSNEVEELTLDGID